MSRNPITATVPFDVPGVHHGHLCLPHSRDDSAWGHVMIPITVICGARPGPTALLSGANHGDEYEGPIALMELALELDPDDVAGRVIILPALNTPAFLAGRRTSPFDGGNMNRAFPGRVDGTPTQKTADYITRELLPMADIVLDFHSGGRTLDFLPFAAAHVLADKAQEARCMAAMQAFNAPFSVRMREIDAAGMYDTEAEAQGKVFVTTELGGGGTARVDTVAVARRGVANLLRHAGIVAGQAESRPSTQLDMPDADCFVLAGGTGMVEPLVDLGDTVDRGQPVARIWPMDRTGAAPAEHCALRAGLLAARHFPGRVQLGDCLAVVAVPVPESSG